MNDPRDLIQRLIAAVKESDDWIMYPETLPVVAEAEAWLATPEPAAGPTDEEIDELAWNWYSKTGSTWWQVDAFRAFARAVLASYGNQPPQPIPLSERLPGPEDCDGEGCIWMWNGHWVRLKAEAASLESWSGSCWLPHHALPLPELERQ